MRTSVWWMVMAAAILTIGCGGGEAPVAAPIAADPNLSAAANRGKVVFLRQAQPACSMCHVLGDAASAGGMGPNLDQVVLDRAKIATTVTNGVGLMPAQSGVLSPTEIDDLASYLLEVSSATVAANSTFPTDPPAVDSAETPSD